MILRLAWEVEERGSNLLVTDGLLVLECATLSFKHDEDQSILRAYDLEGRLRWDVARKNVDHARVAPNVLGGRVVAAIVNADRSAHVVDVETSGVISIEREVPGTWPRLRESLSFRYATIESSDADDRFFFSAFSSAPRVVCGRAGVKEFLWASDAGVLGRTRECARATIPAARRRPGNPGVAALGLYDGAILWEADRFYGSIGSIDAGELFIDHAGTLYNPGPRSCISLLVLPRGDVAWTAAITGKRERAFVARDAVFVLSDLASGEQCLSIVDWNGTAREHTVPNGGPATEIIAVDHGWIVWRNLRDLWCTSTEAPSEIAWRAPFTTPTKDRIDRAAFASDGSLFVLRDGKNLSCWRP